MELENQENIDFEPLGPLTMYEDSLSVDPITAGVGLAKELIVECISRGLLGPDSGNMNEGDPAALVMNAVKARFADVRTCHNMRVLASIRGEAGEERCQAQSLLRETRQLMWGAAAISPFLSEDHVRALIRPAFTYLIGAWTRMEEKTAAATRLINLAVSRDVVNRAFVYNTLASPNNFSLIQRVEILRYVCAIGALLLTCLTISLFRTLAEFASSAQSNRYCMEAWSSAILLATEIGAGVTQPGISLAEMLQVRESHRALLDTIRSVESISCHLQGAPLLPMATPANDSGLGQGTRSPDYSDFPGSPEYTDQPRSPEYTDQPQSPEYINPTQSPEPSTRQARWDPGTARFFTRRK